MFDALFAVKVPVEGWDRMFWVTANPCTGVCDTCNLYEDNKALFSSEEAANDVLQKHWQGRGEVVKA